MKNGQAYDKYMGGASLSFFPINIISLPIMIIIFSVKSERLSEFTLKIQYSVMIVLYIMLVMMFVIPATIILYLKAAVNSIFIAMFRIRQDYKGQNVIQLVVTLFLCPILIPASLLMDIASLPSLIMKPTNKLEHKYKFNSDQMTLKQVDLAMKAFDRVFKYQTSKSFAIFEILKLHIAIFKIIENLHDLTCIGSKDYRAALSTVQDYKTTKLLA